MADEPRPASRRSRREASERAQGGGQGGKAPAEKAPSPQPAVSRPSEISSGFAYTSELPTSDVAAAFAEFAPEGEFEDASEAEPVVEETEPAGQPVVEEAEPVGESAVDPDSSRKPLSRKERRRLERVETPMETWTAEEEARHTGQVPTMTPEAIAHQEETARQKVSQAQEEAIAATGGTPQVKRVSMQTTRNAAAQGQAPAAQGQAPAAQGQAPAAPRHTPEAGLPSGAQQPSASGPPQAIPPGGARPVPKPTDSGIPQPGTQAMPQAAGAFPQPSEAVGAAPTLGDQAANFESLVSGGSAGSGSKPATVPVQQVRGAFQSPGVVQAPGATLQPDGEGASAPVAGAPSGPYAPPGQMIVPGTGTLQTTTGALRTVPGTGAVPRPMVEIHPAGGVRHFGWPQLLLLAAAAFALGVVIWNVAANGS